MLFVPFSSRRRRSCSADSSDSRVRGCPGRKAPINAPNITPDPETGLGPWTDQEIVRAIRDGIGRDGRELLEHPANYYSVMTDEDATAIVSYLRSLRPIRRALAPSARSQRQHERVQSRVPPA
jgi:hypothetical protein